MLFFALHTTAQQQGFAVKSFKAQPVKARLSLKPFFANAIATKAPAIVKTPVSFAITLPADFYAQQLSFFCKKEWQFEKATKIPFKFRLGSVQQCDWLEGKRSIVLVTGN